jgi:DNA-binding transcriptional regulator YiaG
VVAIRNKTKAVLPEWARTIKAVRRKLRLSQAELAEKLETTAMAISRWERVACAEWSNVRRFEHFL